MDAGAYFLHEYVCETGRGGTALQPRFRGQLPISLELILASSTMKVQTGSLGDRLRDGIPRIRVIVMGEAHSLWVEI